MGRGDHRGSGNEMLRFCMPLSLRLQLVFFLGESQQQPCKYVSSVKHWEGAEDWSILEED